RRTCRPSGAGSPWSGCARGGTWERRVRLGKGKVTETEPDDGHTATAGGSAELPARSVAMTSAAGGVHGEAFAPRSDLTGWNHPGGGLHVRVSMAAGAPDRGGAGGQRPGRSQGGATVEPWRGGGPGRTAPTRRGAGRGGGETG